MLFIIIFFLLLSSLLYQLFLIIECHLFLSAKTISLICSFLLSTILYDHIGYHKNDTSVLHIGISPDYYPFTFIDENHQIKGFDIDLANAIGVDIDYHIEFVPMQFEALIPSLQLATIDALIGGLGTSEEREKNLLPSIPYYHNRLCVLSTKENKIDRLSAVLNQSCIIISGYNTYDFIQETKLTEKILCVKSFADGLLYLDLDKGKYFFTHYTSIAGNPLIQLNYSIYTVPEYNEPIVIFYNKKNTVLKNAIDQALIKLENSHIIKEYKEKWNL